jgi:hypothetical protein
MQDAGGFVGAPVGVDIGPVPEKKVSDLEARVASMMRATLASKPDGYLLGS